jgi:hypothetical protein
MTLSTSEIEEVKFIALTSRDERDFETSVVNELGPDALAGWREYQIELRQSDPTVALQINALAHRCATASQRWYVDESGNPLPENIDRDLMLIVGEAVEAHEHYRHNDRFDDKLPHRRGVEAELADLIVRCLGLSARRGYDIGGTILDKLAFNASREDHSLEARRDPAGTGKRF